MQLEDERRHADQYKEQVWNKLFVDRAFIRIKAAVKYYATGLKQERFLCKSTFVYT